MAVGLKRKNAKFFKYDAYCIYKYDWLEINIPMNCYHPRVCFSQCLFRLLLLNHYTTTNFILSTS